MTVDLVRAASARWRAGQLDEATALLETAAAADQRLNQALGELQFERGNARLADGRLEAAAGAFARAAELLPEHAAAAFNLGIAQERLGRRGEAESAYRQALARDALLSQAWNNLLLLLKNSGRSGTARQAGRRALAADPGFYAAQVNLGDVLVMAGRIDEALGPLARAAALHAEPWEALATAGLAFALAGKVEAALSALRRGLALNPSAGVAWNNLASAAPAVAAVVVALRRTLALAPDDAAAHSNLIFALTYGEGADVAAEAGRWAARHCPRRPAPRFAQSRDPERRLRVGYVSGDLRQHPIAWNVEALLRQHRRGQVEVAAYSATPTPDHVTRRIAGAVDLWRDVAGLAPAEIADRMRADAVDILVVLAGHAGANPLATACHRPSPVQVSFHDVATSGLPTMNAWLTDPVLHPDGTTERFSERLLRLPCFYLHLPPEEAPALRPRASGPPVFGSFNNPLKLGPGVLTAWRRILDALPGAALLLKYKNRFASPLVQAPIRAALGDRVRFLAGDVGRAEQLALWQQVDVALDPFPFNGSTTSFEALWMGVPVVTLAGERFVGRVGASLLAQVGLSDLVSSTVDGYVARATALAGDRGRLDSLRQALRGRVAASPLCDAEAHARAVESAYRDLWRSWCKS
jgi:predicted O-linked N-acetylglucosamine transferase (SPINDLY family)